VPFVPFVVNILMTSHSFAIDPNKIWGLFGFGLPAYYFGIVYLILSLSEGILNKKISLTAHILGILVGILYVIYFIK
jgi:membrane associated rhomboid family serine protease